MKMLIYNKEKNTLNNYSGIADSEIEPGLKFLFQFGFTTIPAKLENSDFNFHIILPEKEDNKLDIENFGLIRYLNYISDQTLEFSEKDFKLLNEKLRSYRSAREFIAAITIH